MAAVRKIAAALNTWPGWKQFVPGRVPGLLAVALGLFVIAALALSFNLGRLKVSFTWVEHTNEVIRNIGAVERALLEAESGERGYLLTGDRTYLDNYSRARAEISPLLQRLERLISDNQDQTRRLTELGRASNPDWPNSVRSFNWALRVSRKRWKFLKRPALGN
jgi:uncharacterized protein (UPF0297 family)